MFLLSIMIFIPYSGSAQTGAYKLNNDLEMAVGTWKGFLIYLDYSSDKAVSLPAELVINQIGKKDKFLFSFFYPDEPNANSTDTITVSTDGKQLNNETVISRTMSTDGEIVIVSGEKGEDGNEDKSALIRHTYTIGENVLKIRKDILFDGQTEWINRHEFSFVKY